MAGRVSLRLREEGSVWICRVHATFNIRATAPTTASMPNVMGVSMDGSALWCNDTVVKIYETIVN